MPRIWSILNQFTGGEVSPEVWGRTETDQWPAMLETVQNCYISPRGGIKRRPGLQFVKETKYPTRNSRLIPFVFSEEQSYILELGHYYIRFFKDEGWVTDISNVSSFIADGSSTDFAYEYDDTTSGDIKVYVDGVLKTVTTDYTVAAINKTTNQINGFTTTADYDTDADSVGDPWVLSSNTAQSPGDYDPILENTATDLAIGATVDIAFTLSQHDVVTNTETSTDATNIGLSNTEYISVLTHTVTRQYESATWAFDVQFDNDTADTITYRVKHNGVVVKEGTATLDGTNPTLVNCAAVDFNYTQLNDTIELEAISSAGSAPFVYGAAETTTITVVGTFNSDPKLYVGMRGNDDYDTVEEVSSALEAKTVQMEMNMPKDATLIFAAQEGLQATVEDPSIKYANDGFIVTFNSAPAANAIVTIVDDAKTGTTAAESTSTKSFQIQSPYREDQLEELYFAQANDVMVICHDEHKPMELTRYGPYDWRVERNVYTGAPWEDGGYDAADGYPRTVAYFQEKLFFGGTIAQPQTLWSSRAADFHDFTIPATPQPDDPLEYTIAAYTHEAIEWLSSERVLIIGTSATEHRLAPDQYLATDRLPTVSRMSAYGGAHIKPAYMGNLTVFVQTAGNQVRTFEQETQTVVEKWDSIQLDWMARHLTEPRVKQICYALIPDSLLQMVTLDGDQLVMTYEPTLGDEANVGWAKYTTDGDFKSIAVIPEDDKDQTWVIVDRDGNRYVEYYNPDRYTDSCLTYPNANSLASHPIQQVGGLDHLEGKTVTVKAGGATHPDLTVNNGEVTLDDYYDEIEIGLPYTPLIKLQRFALASEPSNLQGQMGRWVEVWLRMVESAYPKVDGVRAAERDPATGMSTPEAVVTGDVKVYNLGFDREKQLTIEQDLPLPLHITAVYGVMEVHGG